MNVNVQRNSLFGLATLLSAATVGVAFWAMEPLDPETTQLVAGNGSETTPPVPSTGARTELDDETAVRLLRRPLYDPPPQAPPKQDPAPPSKPRPTPPPRLDVTLVGTIIDPAESMAILADASGKFDVKGVGELLELSPAGMTLQSVESEQVTLSFRGQTSTIKLVRAKKPRATGGNRNNNRRRNRP